MTMTVQELETRIQNAEAKIRKKTGTIDKYREKIAKLEGKLEKTLGRVPNWETDQRDADVLENDDAYWSLVDIKRAVEGIRKNESMIARTQAAIEKDRTRLLNAVETEKQVSGVPVLRDMETGLVQTWDREDMERRERIATDYRNLPLAEFYKRWSGAEAQLRKASDEEIHRQNVKDARILVLDLYRRVEEITGPEITSWDCIRAETGTRGCVVLNGYVKGAKGTARVKSILAGGYNIQRLHVRVLVHKVA